MNLSFFCFNRFHVQSLQRRQAIVALLCALVLAPQLLWFQSRVPLAESSSTHPSREFYSPRMIRFISMGYWLAAVDWMWIQTLQVVGAKTQDPELIPMVDHFYAVATDLDPEFYDLYEQAGVLFSFFFHAPNEAIRYLEKGIQHSSEKWTHSYTLYLLTAYLYAYEKNDWAKAKEYYLKAAEVKGAPAYLQSMKVWLQEKDAEKNLANRVLLFLVKTTSDPVLKEQYEKKLSELKP